jgi:uncharacterized coiled-coil DUF342 family protein
MRERYEELKEMLMNHQREVMQKKAEFNKEVKGLTKDARQYKLQLDGYSEEITRNINTINKRLQKLKD